MFLKSREKNSFSCLLTAALTVSYLVLWYVAGDSFFDSQTFDAALAVLGFDTVILCIVVYFTDGERYARMLEELVKNRHYAIVVTDKAMNIIYKNKSAEDLFRKLSPLQFIEEYALAGESELSKIRVAYLNNFPTEASITCKDANGAITYYRTYVRPIEDNCFAWIFEDISPDIAILDTMDKDLRFYKAAFNNIPSVECVCDIEGKIKSANSAFLEETGYTESEIKETNITDIIDISTNELSEKNIQSATFIAKNGTKTAFAIAKSVHTVANENYIYISAIKNEKSSYPTSDDNQILSPFGQLFNDSPIGIVFCDNFGEITHANPAMQNMLKLKTPLGSSILNHIALGDRSNFLVMLEKISLSDMYTCQSIQVEMIDGSDEKNTKTISVMIYVTKRYNANHKSDGLTLHFIDITQEKLLTAQIQAVQSEDTIKKITGGIAHDIRNRMAALETAAESLMIGKSAEDSSYKYASIIYKGVELIKGTISSLLFRTKQQESKKDDVKIETIINYYKENNIRSMLDPEIKDKITIKTNCEHVKPDGYIRADLIQIYNSIDNLIINAKDAMYPAGGTLYVTFADETVQREFQYQVYNTTETVYPGDYLLIEITDTGCGIEEKNLPRIFDHYFTTKQGKGFKNSGSGIGLSIVYGTIKQSNGHIIVNSKIGEGTSFKILLPKEIIKKDVKNKEQPVKADIAPLIGTNNQYSFVNLLEGPSDEKENGDFKISNLTIAEESGIRILLIEDDNDIRFLLTDFISKLGYEAISCDCAESAAEIIKKDKNFKLMLSDIMMPGMNGIEFLKIIKTMIPKIKVILMSGYSEGLINEEVTENETLKIISKPFSMTDLSQKIKELLNV